MYNCIIFDLDGTLLNTIDDLADAGNYALGTLGFPLHEIKEYKYFVGNGIPKLIERILPCGAEEYSEKLHQLFSEYYSQHFADKTKPYNGIIPLLDKLKEHGVKTAVVSNKDHDFSEALIKRYFADRIMLVCGRKDGIPAKPDPYSVNLVLNLLNSEKGKTLYVGDSGVDMKTAFNAGLDSCGVLWGFRKEDELLKSGAKYIAHNCTELYDIIWRI